MKGTNKQSTESWQVSWNFHKMNFCFKAESMINLLKCGFSIQAMRFSLLIIWLIKTRCFVKDAAPDREVLSLIAPLGKLAYLEATTHERQRKVWDNCSTGLYVLRLRLLPYRIEVQVSKSAGPFQNQRCECASASLYVEQQQREHSSQDIHNNLGGHSFHLLTGRCP